MDVHIKIIGYTLVILSLIHLVFPKYFNWKEELNRISLVNKEMMVIHTFFIAVAVLLMGILCIGWSNDLANSKLGSVICFGLGVFWGVRLIIQWFGYSASLWLGKPFETVVHVIFTFMWFYIAGVFFITAFQTVQ